MMKTEPVPLKNMGRNPLYYLAAFFMPSILLFFLYNRNYVLNHIVFENVLVLAGVLAVVGLLLFWVLKRIAKSTEGALLITLLFWLSFWQFERLLNLVTRYFALTATSFMVVLGMGFVFVAMLFRRYEPPFFKIRPAFNAMAISLVALFVFNLISGANHNLMLYRARVEMVDEDARPFYIKQDFYIDTTLPTPDIHWFHLDGMVSLETVESFFGEYQEHLREEFTRRGFVVYENATLNAGRTDPAIAALLSPALYDSFLRELFSETETILSLGAMMWTIENRLAQVGLTFYENIMPYRELPSALIMRGYEIESIYGGGVRMPLSTRYLTANLGRWHRFLRWFLRGDLPELLSLTTPLNISLDTIRAAAVARQSDYGPEPVARFFWHNFWYAHMLNVWRQDPALTEVDLTLVDLYPLAFEFTAQRVLRLVDITLEENPTAVIVLQSDHGINMDVTKEHLLNQGYTPDHVLELRHSVFSAVRIPPQYGGLDAPIAPLNISRELVNRFVGQNYNLLP